MKSKERLYRWIAAVICATFLIIAYKASGQINRLNRYVNNPEVVTLVPDGLMKFEHDDNDTIYLSILADSTYVTQYALFSFFPGSVNNYMIEIGFTDNSFETFKATSIKGNYAEFEIYPKQLDKLRSRPFDTISFINNNVLQTCIKVKTKNYFMDFLKQVR